jgi:hypothetical protein
MRFLLCLLFFLPSLSWSQYKCATDELTKLRAESSLEYAEGLEEMDLLAIRFESGLATLGTRDSKKIIIPVVVHVIYREESDNISMEQIHSQIDVLNRDFNWQQSDKAKIPEVWRNLGAESGFEFKLAEKDSDGNFTNGVTRRQTEIEDIANVDNVGSEIRYYKAANGGTDPWFQAHYLNVWVCEIGDRVLGYTYLPSANNLEPNDGIVIEARAFGTTGTATAPYNGGRTLVHEMGHYFGLRHLGGGEEGSCTNTDYMSDTPWQREANFNCSNYPSISCPAERKGDMFMNFMDYADDTCSLFFTKNQIEYMQLVLRTAKVTLIHSEGVTGIEESEIHELSVSPNPSNGVFRVYSVASNNETYEVWNALGQIVFEGVFHQGLATLYLADQPKGVYYLRIEQGYRPLVLTY